MANPQTPLLRLAGLKIAQLPPASATPDELKPFITALLQEALPFIDSADPRTVEPTASLWKSKGTKKFPESAAKVELSERVLTLPSSSSAHSAPSETTPAESNTSSSDAPAADAAATTTTKAAKTKAATATATTTTTTATTSETWACRRSVHIDAATKGTASWAEFARCLRDEHAATEDAFTPTVLAHREALSWTGARDVGPIAVGGGGKSGNGNGNGDDDGDGALWWGGFSLALVEMKHRIPPPLKPRVFPVLQLIASGTTAAGEGGGNDGGLGSVGAPERARDEFVVVSVPVVDLAGSELGVLSKEPGVVVGAYAAVERVRKEAGARGDVEWIMATASDAKGVLPMWVQTKAVPGQIAKDVALFLGWIEGERKAGKGDGHKGEEEEAAAAAHAS